MFLRNSPITEYPKDRYANGLKGYYLLWVPVFLLKGGMPAGMPLPHKKDLFPKEKRSQCAAALEGAQGAPKRSRLL